MNWDLRKTRAVVMLSSHLFRTVVLAALCFLLVGCTLQVSGGLDQMITRFGSSLPGLWRLVTASSYILGMVLIFRAVYQLKMYGDLRTMMSTQTNFKATLMLFLAGSALIFYQPAYQTFLMSTFGTSTPSPIGWSTGPIGLNLTTRVILQFVQIIGFVSFVRGWIYLTQASNPGGHATFGKALTHIVGGVLLINIEGTKNVFQASLGLI